MREEDYIAQIEDFYQNAPCGYLTLGTNGKIVGMNNTLLSWIGAERPAIEGVAFFREILSAGSRIYFETHVLPLVQMQGFVSEVNLEMKGKAGKLFPVLINVNSATDKENGKGPYRFTVIDYSQRKLYEAELLAAQKAAEKSAARLSAMNEELERFAHTASHDLQAPLNTITGLVQLIEYRDYLKPDPKAVEIFEMIVRNTRRMKSMIRDLLEYQRIDAPTEKFERVSLEDMCREALDGLVGEIEASGATFEIGPLPMISGVRIRLIRLFQNLFSNAIKYRSEDPPVVTVSGYSKGDSAFIEVADNGVGFDPSNAEKIFGFMERLQSRDEIEGTGIGLSTCRRIMEAHGGKISADSRQGEGSVFFIEFPKA